MGTEFDAAFKAYLEIGILGLCGVLVVVITWLNFKRNQERSKQQDELQKKQYEELMEQNKQYQQQAIESQEKLMDRLIQNGQPHVLSAEEDNKLTKINNQIDKTLQDLLIKTNASRANLVQYHNGGKGKNNQSFLKMSMTNEITDVGVKPVISEFKDQFRNVLAYFVREIQEKGYCFIPDAEKMKDIDYSMYDFLTCREVQAKFGIAIHSPNNPDNVVGFVCLEYLDKTKANEEIIKEQLKQKEAVLETLLSM